MNRLTLWTGRFGALILAAGAIAATLAAPTEAIAATVAAGTAAGGWNPVVAQAMRYVQDRTGMTLEAPAYTGNRNGYESGVYLAVTAQAGSRGYAVGLQISTTPASVNSPVLSQPPNTGLAAVLGGFGARTYPSSAQVLSVLSLTPARPEQGNLTAAISMRGTKSRRINLGNGIQGALFDRRGWDVVQWREGEWGFQVNGSYPPGDRALASQVVAYLHTHLLPEAHGLMVVNNAGDGEHTSLSWAYGDTVYNTWDYHHALSAVKMAMSMRPYHAPPAFSVPVLRAMRSVASRTSLALQAPRDLGLAAADSGRVTAQANVGRHQYTVSLGSGQAVGLASQIGSFGAQAYAQGPAALRQLGQMAQPPQYAGARYRMIPLGNGITGRLYNQLGFVYWREGAWTLTVQAGAAAADTRLAAQVVAYLHAHLLPETHGFMWIKNTPAAEFTHLYWVWGNVMYSVYSVHSARQALRMAVSYTTF